MVKAFGTFAACAAGWFFMEFLGALIRAGHPMIALFLGMLFTFFLGCRWAKTEVTVNGDHNTVISRGFHPEG